MAGVDCEPVRLNFPTHSTKNPTVAAVYHVKHVGMEEFPFLVFHIPEKQSHVILGSLAYMAGRQSTCKTLSHTSVVFMVGIGCALLTAITSIISFAHLSLILLGIFGFVTLLSVASGGNLLVHTPISVVDIYATNPATGVTMVMTVYPPKVIGKPHIVRLGTAPATSAW